MRTFFAKQHALAAMALVAVLAGTGQQAQAGEVVPPTSKWVDCLSFVPGAPTAISYPKDMEALNVNSRVNAVLTFTSPNRGPELSFEGSAPLVPFANALKQYVSNMRLSCMDGGPSKIVLKQTFDFDALGHRIAKASQVDDPELKEKARYNACMVHKKPGSVPEFPRRASRDGREAHVFATLRFTQADKAPEVSLSSTRGQADFDNAVNAYVEDLRIPCLGKEPFVTTIHYMFMFSEDGRVVLKSGTLAEFLKFAKADTKSAKFDFNTMSCPFDVKLRYTKPYMANSVVQLDNYDGARKPFLDWLKDLELQFDNKTREKVIGSNVVLSVPCGQLEF
ncbi:hypothetical protein [Undibacterium squillarum]|uniref:hypothetical protein n=1 Tax=Undibacterium squillarum TaxID=1131567 RepID=UPI0035AEF589